MPRVSLCIASACGWSNLRNLLLRQVIPRLLPLRHFELDEVVPLARAEGRLDADAWIALGHGGLEAPAAACTVRAHVLDVNGRSDHLYVVQRELRALRHYPPVHDNHRAAVVVQPVAVASLLVCVQVDTAGLSRRREFA